MSDGWKDARHRPLINFLVYCSKGISFIKSIDASDIESNAKTLCNLFSKRVEIVDSKNVFTWLVIMWLTIRLLEDCYVRDILLFVGLHVLLIHIEELYHVDSLVTLASVGT
ncbi:hypothetical protein OSB04_011510 [Centaurea solstitialis]|uniref:DUF659 domain-containing protein n=1 Tax=Centaurea solstitialis TaxID=347529 RepID=A0AA38WQ49_9ASTR|nr:hypothetical protein OSB04_011510 [Centaurea solstitialis]